MRKESTTTFLRRGFISTLALVATLLISCGSDITNEGNADNNNGIANNGELGLKAIAHSKEIDELGTRSNLTYSDLYGMQFSWTEDDALTIFAAGNYSNRMTYALQSGAGSTNATFQSDKFELTPNTFYFALSKSETTAGGETKIPDLRNITLDYSGQTQTGNANYTHLGAYDYMAAGTQCIDKEKVHFSFTHLGATLRLTLHLKDTDTDEDFKNTEFTKLEIYDSENSYKQPLRHFSFEAGLSGDKYSPIWPEQTIAVDAPRFTLNLKSNVVGHDGIVPTDAFGDGSGAPETKGTLVLYVEVPPVDLIGKTLGFIISGKKKISEGNYENKTYYCTMPGFKINADKAYRRDLTLEKPTEYKVTLKINHLWQHGATEETTRATGDPGYDKEYGLPAHVYYIFCVNGKVRTVKHLGNPSASADAVNHFETSTTEGQDWKTVKTPEQCVSTLIKEGEKELVFAVKSGEEETTKHLYVVASKQALTLNVDDEASEEDVVRTLKYNIPSSDAQVFMRDLYSTPYEADASFVGNISDPVQDVFLYHVAAKVDLKWNSTTEITPGADKNVSVNTVKNSGLSLFLPTTNENTPGSYTVTTPITWGTCYNGRQVYYLPQFANNTYNVTIGAKTSDVQFTGTTTTGGFTSWLRGLIKQ